MILWCLGLRILLPSRSEGRKSQSSLRDESVNRSPGPLNRTNPYNRQSTNLRPTRSGRFLFAYLEAWPSFMMALRKRHRFRAKIIEHPMHTHKEHRTMNSSSPLISTEQVTQVPFSDRRQQLGTGVRGERRQFGNSYRDLSPEGQQLAEAIDAYKVDHRRRYITTDELLGVLNRLGYKQTLSPTD